MNKLTFTCALLSLFLSATTLYFMKDCHQKHFAFVDTNKILTDVVSDIMKETHAPPQMDKFTEAKLMSRVEKTKKTVLESLQTFALDKNLIVVSVPMLHGNVRDLTNEFIDFFNGGNK